MTPKEAREARLAAQLRANLRRRKVAPADGETVAAAPAVDTPDRSGG